MGRPSDNTAQHAPQRLEAVTPAEKVILLYLSHGPTITDLARMYDVSRYTMRDRVRTIQVKLAAKNAAHAVAIALRHGLID